MLQREKRNLQKNDPRNTSKEPLCRVEWVDRNGTIHHGGWIPYSIAKSHVDTENSHYPSLLHRLVFLTPSLSSLE